MPSLAWPIFALICCCPLGVASLISYNEATSARDRNDYNGYKSSADSAKCYGKCAVGIGCTIFTLYLLIVVALGGILFSAADDMSSAMSSSSSYSSSSYYGGY